MTVTVDSSSSVWNGSDSVVVALTPTLCLALVDRTSWPVLAVPWVMVPDRVYSEARVQSAAG